MITGLQMNIKNYIPEKYKPLYGSLSDILAVKADIKPVARLSCTKEFYPHVKKVFEAENLKVEISEKPFGSQYYVYLSKSDKLAQEAKKCDNSFNYQNMSGEELSASVEKFGIILGYPKCCAKFLAGNMNLYGKQAGDKLKPHEPISFLLNNLLNGFSNHYLSFHQPCSYNCSKSLEYLEKIYNVIANEEPKFRDELDRYLKGPYLVIFNLNLSLNVAWERRSGFCFDGRVKNNTIDYKDFAYFKTNYPDYENVNANEAALENIKKMISRGNKIVCRDDMVYFYKDEHFLGSIMNKDTFHISLFVFV